MQNRFNTPEILYQTNCNQSITLLDENKLSIESKPNNSRYNKLIKHRAFDLRKDHFG